MYLRIDADGLAAFLAHIGENAFVALDAVWMLITQHVPLPGQTVITVPATKVPRVPILGHGFSILATKN